MTCWKLTRLDSCCTLARSQSFRQSVQYLNLKESRMKKGSTKGGKGGKGGCK